MNVIIWVNHYGWIMGEKHDGDALTGLRFTKAREGAKPYDEGGEALMNVRRYVEEMGCHYDLERIYFGGWKK